MMKDKFIYIEKWEDDFRLAKESNPKSFPVPEGLWHKHINARTAYRDSHSYIKIFRNPPKDKPMYVTKNHTVEVKPGEIHVFEGDGSVTIIKDETTQ